jgi:protein-L-isoaspartate(D-aspartate) O-methyltransferase
MKSLRERRHDDRRRLLSEIEAEAATVGGFSKRGLIDPRVLDAIADVPREMFVDPEEEGYAYANIPLPIGYGQTISQPFIVALMTDLLRPQPHDVVLEIGTGSGYQAAVLARLVKHVYSVEIIPELADSARTCLARLGIENVSVRCADGYQGWPEHAPFDGIIVTAAARAIPQPLIEQLARSGRLVIPVEDEIGDQELFLLEKSSEGEVTKHSILPVAFVPLTGRS